MIIVIEGIDGAGKSTIIRNMCQTNLLSNLCNVKYIDKKKISDTWNTDERKKLLLLQQMIWDKNEFLYDPFGARFWIKLIAAWYSILEPKINNRHSVNEIRIYDGWYYRNIIKTNLRENISKEWIELLFQDITPPDVTILLDIDPEIAWKRDPNKKITEVGYWDGEKGSKKESFIRYQTRIRNELLKLAQKSEWKVINLKETDSPEYIAEKIAKYLSPYIETKLFSAEELDM